MEFQIVDWFQYHELDSNDEEIYTIAILGRMQNGEDVCLRVIGFQPFFYVKYPDSWNIDAVKYFVNRMTMSVAAHTKRRVDLYAHDMSTSLEDHRIVRRKDFFFFSNETKEKFIKMTFKSYTAMKAYAAVIRWDKPKVEKGRIMAVKLYESNVDPFLRMIHIRNITPCGWIRVEKEHLTLEKEYSHCDHSYSINWNHISPINIDSIAPLKIMGYDIECVSSDTNFPQAGREKDEAIQIGMTIYEHGSMICDEEIILVLGKCNKIKSKTAKAKVICYATEMDMFMGFANTIRKVRPDIKAGYNNCIFDDKYIRDRIKFLEKKFGDSTLLEKFLRVMGKLNNQYIMDTYGVAKCPTTYTIKPLSSAALGDNILEFFDPPGIVTVDMYKVIQRDHSLDSYKLDNVAAVFITEGIMKMDVIDEDEDNVYLGITTRSTKALEEESYIQIMVNDGYSSSPFFKETKFFVEKIGPTSDGKNQVISTSMKARKWGELNEAMKDPTMTFFWTFAKDDMHHTLINKYYNEADPKKVAIVAKYCLKDCKLVNLLMAKLDIISNSMGMGNVCYVPFSFLFRRGQGIKIFSLVLKTCSEEGYLIPALKKAKDDVDGVYYEGAMVITPKPAVYTSPIPVLDFNSLYPNSMRECNLCPSCYVRDKQYDNLPNYVYHDIHIKEKDREGNLIRDKNKKVVVTHHRFAQKLISDEEIRNEMEDFITALETKMNESVAERSVGKKASEKKTIAEEEKAIMEKKISDEKYKRYNVVDGKMVRYGILPKIITKLLNARKAANARLALEKDPVVKSILNGIQLALKVTANSLYGQTGSDVSPIFFLAIASSTTYIGRKRLAFAKDIIESNFEGSEIIYGDSVTADTPITYRDIDGLINVTTIEALGTTWKPYDAFKAGESNRKHKQQCDDLDIEVWSCGGWAKVKRVIRHKTVKKIYRVLTHTGCIDVTEDHSLLDVNGDVIKPTECVVGTELLHGFMEHESGVIDGSMRHVVEGKENAQRLFIQSKCMGYNMSIESVTPGDVYDMVFSRAKHVDANAVKDIHFLRYSNNEYVYDLETEDGTFHAGVGEMIIKNTDSVFVNFHIRDKNGEDRTDREALVRSIDLAKKAADIINANVPKPQMIVYEKTMHPLILVAKKKYVGLLYGDNPDKYYIKSMGIVLKRRDNPPIVKIAIGGIINMILKERDVVGAVEYLIRVLVKMIDEDYPVEKFVLSKKLRAKYDDPTRVAHWVLVNRIGQRDLGSKPSVGDRIPFVHIYKRNVNKKNNVLQGDLVESPEYAADNNLKLDYLYYITNQIMNPATQLLELVLKPAIIKKLFDEIISLEINRREKYLDAKLWLKNPHVGMRDLHIKDNIIVNREMNTSNVTQPNLTKWMEGGEEEVVIIKKKKRVLRKKKITGEGLKKWIN